MVTQYDTVSFIPATGNNHGFFIPFCPWTATEIHVKAAQNSVFFSLIISISSQGNDLK